MESRQWAGLGSWALVSSGSRREMAEGMTADKLAVRLGGLLLPGVPSLA